MVVAQALEWFVALPAIGEDCCVLGDAVQHERGQCQLAPVWHVSKPEAACVRFATDGTPLLVLLPLPLLLHYFRGAASNLDSTDDGGLVMNASSLAPRVPPNLCLVDFDDILGAPDLVVVRSHHCGPEFVEEHECGLVATDAELTLELEGRHPRRLRRDQVGGPEPNLQRCLGVVHDRAGCNRRVGMTRSATQRCRPILEAVRFTRDPALGAGKTIRPAKLMKVGSTRPLVWKHSLEVQQGRRQRLCHRRKYYRLWSWVTTG